MTEQIGDNLPRVPIGNSKPTDVGLSSEARLAAAKARVRALEQRMGFGRGPVLMMAGGIRDLSPEQAEELRAAWRIRTARRKKRTKDGLARIVFDNVPQDAFTGLMMELGVYVRPSGRAPSFTAAL